MCEDEWEGTRAHMARAEKAVRREECGERRVEKVAGEEGGERRA